MATKTVKICDRCGAQHEQASNTSVYPVQKVTWAIPFGTSLHGIDYKKPSEKELCTPCRAAMSTMIRDFMEAK